MTTANWFQLIGTLLVLAVTWGEVRSRLKQVEKLCEATAAELTKSRSAQGNRLGDIEKEVAHLEGTLGVLPRRRTHARGVPVVDDDD